MEIFFTAVKHQEGFLARGWPGPGLGALSKWTSFFYPIVMCFKIQGDAWQISFDTGWWADVCFAAICPSGAVPIAGGCVIFLGGHPLVAAWQPTLVFSPPLVSLYPDETPENMGCYCAQFKIHGRFWACFPFLGKKKRYLKYFCTLGELLCTKQQRNTPQFLWRNKRQFLPTKTCNIWIIHLTEV